MKAFESYPLISAAATFALSQTTTPINTNRVLPPISKARSARSATVFMIASAFGGVALAQTATLPFIENFTSPTLNPTWQELSGLGRYTVGNGQLRVYSQGPQASTTGWYNPAKTLALQFNGNNWEIETKANYNLNWCISGNYTGPSIPNQTCSSGAQGPEVLVSFKPGVLTSGYGGPNYCGSDCLVITEY